LWFDFSDKYVQRQYAEATVAFDPNLMALNKQYGATMGWVTKAMAIVPNQQSQFVDSRPLPTMVAGTAFAADICIWNWDLNWKPLARVHADFAGPMPALRA